MEIKYLYHSGVSVKSGNMLLIFDYYRKGIDENEIKNAGEVFVFASHRHGDHFDKDIFDWQELNPGIKYILSSDIETGASDKVFLIAPDEEMRTGDIVVKTLESTDEGVAFVVRTPEGSVFHAGDLSWWHWEGEPDENNREIADKFKAEIDKIAKTKIDVAFIPMDQRLEGSRYFSIDYLMENVDVAKVCPIHFWDDWDFIMKAKKDLAERPYYSKIYFYGR